MTAMFNLKCPRIGMAVVMGAAISGPTVFAASAHDTGSCLVEVLYSEMLPAAPPFYHTVRARLRVTPPDQPPFETTVVRTIPWPAPPPRQGQRIREACEQASAQSLFHPF